jgi:hypothetical protein
MTTECTENHKRQIHWPTVLYYIHLHAFGLYGLMLLLTEAKWMTVFFSKNIFCYNCAIQFFKKIIIYVVESFHKKV